MMLRVSNCCCWAEEGTFWIYNSVFYGFVVKDDGVLLDDQSVTCSEEGPTVTAAHPPRPPSATPTPAAPPDLIQNTPTFKVDILKVRRGRLWSILFSIHVNMWTCCGFQSVSEAPPAPSNLEPSFCCPPPQQKQNLFTVTASSVLKTAPLWSSPDPHASAYGQGIYTCMRLYSFWQHSLWLKAELQIYFSEDQLRRQACLFLLHHSCCYQGQTSPLLDEIKLLIIYWYHLSVIRF